MRARHETGWWPRALSRAKRSIELIRWNDGKAQVRCAEPICYPLCRSQVIVGSRLPAIECCPAQCFHIGHHSLAGNLAHERIERGRVVDGEAKGKEDREENEDDLNPATVVYGRFRFEEHPIQPELSPDTHGSLYNTD